MWVPIWVHPKQAGTVGLTFLNEQQHHRCVVREVIAVELTFHSFWGVCVNQDAGLVIKRRSEAERPHQVAKECWKPKKAMSPYLLPLPVALVVLLFWSCQAWISPGTQMVEVIQFASVVAWTVRNLVWKNRLRGTPDMLNWHVPLS